MILLPHQLRQKSNPKLDRASVIVDGVSLVVNQQHCPITRGYRSMGLWTLLVAGILAVVFSPAFLFGGNRGIGLPTVVYAVVAASILPVLVGYGPQLFWVLIGRQRDRPGWKPGAPPRRSRRGCR